MPTIARTLVVAVLAAIGLALAGSPGHAADPDHFDACGSSLALCPYTWANGSVAWNNRTATVYAAVVCDRSSSSTTAFFDGYAGANHIHRVSRTSREGCLALPNLAVGDPALPGGINILRVTVCVNVVVRDCGPTEVVYRG